MHPTTPPPRPYGRYAVGLRPSLDPDACFDAVTIGFALRNLAVLDAQIEPPEGLHAFDASAAAEAQARIGPDPTEDIDRVTDTLLADFNAARRGRTDPAVVEPLLGPLRDHYRRLVEPVWKLMDRAVAREQQLPAARLELLVDRRARSGNRGRRWRRRGTWRRT